MSGESKPRDRWSPVDKVIANEALRSWGYPGLPVDPAPMTAGKDPLVRSRSKRSPGGGRGDDTAPAATA